MNIQIKTPQSVATTYLDRLSRVVASIDRPAFDHAIGLIRKAWEDGRQIITFGNGGSALTAEHYITDWNKSIYLSSGRPFRGVCLCENMGLMSAYANDISYEDIFIAQLKPVLTPGDLVLGISGSGNSENVLRAIRYANENGGITLGVTGYDGGKLRKLAQHAICAEVMDMQLSEDIHLIFGHMVMQSLCGMMA
ncbi:MAG: SIS domain-containing protein [Methylovirgula sp.]